MLKLLPLVLVALMLSGCLMPPTRKISIDAPWKADQAAYIDEVGAGAIVGKAIFNGIGGTFIPSHVGVTLTPYSDYSAERFQKVFDDGVYLSRNRDTVEVTPTPPQYIALRRTTVTDIEGNFAFTKLAPGRYFIVLPVRWYAAGVRFGGMLMKEATVTEGKTTSLLISN